MEGRQHAQAPPAWHGAALRGALLPLNGLRTISTVAVMVFHHLCLRRHFGHDALNAAFRRNPGPTHAILQGFIGLDVLFVICGFLAAITLIPLLEDRRRPVKQAVWLYYWRRAARIAPAHWTSLLLAYLTVLRGRDQIPVPEAVGALLHYEPESCPWGLWVQAAFMGQYQWGGGCSMHTWSQGTQAAFWTLVPLLMAAAGPRRPGFRKRVAWIAGVTIVVSTAYRAWAVWWYDIPLPIVVLASSHLHQENVDFRNYQFQFHYPLLCRAASLAIGFLTALPLLDSRCWRSPAPKQSAAQQCGVEVQQPCENGNYSSSSSSTRDQRAGHSSGNDCAAATADSRTDVTMAHLSAMPTIIMILGTSLTTLAIYVLTTTRVIKPAGNPSWPRAQSLAYLVLMVQGGIVSSAAISFMMAAAMAGVGPAGRVLRLLLGGPSWKPLADFSYSAYLYHEHVRFWVWRFCILPSGLAKSADDLWAFAVDMAVCVPATFAVGAVSYHLVERPAAAAARRLEPLLFDGGYGSENGNQTTAADVSKAKAA